MFGALARWGEGANRGLSSSAGIGCVDRQGSVYGYERAE
jgi:hypothetical protein